MRRKGYVRQVLGLLVVCSLLAVVSSAGIAHAEVAYSPVWTCQFGTSVADHALRAATDTYGNIYLVGHTYGTFNGQVSAGNWDVFVTKYNVVGVMQWTRQLGTAGEDNGYGVAADAFGNVYVTGWTLGTFEGQTRIGHRDMFVAKFNSSGVKQWTRQFGTAVDDYSYGAATDVSGNVYVVGDTIGEIDGQTNAGGSDLLLTKYDPNGFRQWTKQLGTVTQDYSYDVATDASGNIYITGRTNGALDGQTSAGSYDMFLVKYDSSGAKQWTRQLGAASDDYGRGVATDADGNVYVAGYTFGAIDGQTSAGYGDMFLTKYGPDGSKLWTQQFGTSSDDLSWDVATDVNGDVYVTGRTSGDLDGQTNAGSIDVYVTKYDSSGVRQWTVLQGNASNNYSCGVATAAGENVYIAGYTHGSLNGQASAGSYDSFLIRLCPYPPESDPPTSTITDPLDGVTLPAPLNNYTIHGTADDGAGSGVAFVDVSTDGGSTWHRATGTTSWYYTWILPLNGTYNLISRATDNSGNIEAAGAGIDVTVDNPPKTTILMPADLEAIPAALGNYSITGTTVDRSGTGIQKVEVSTDSGNSWSDAVDGPGDGSWSWWSYQWAPPALGSYTIKARGTDNGGRIESGGSGVAVVVDGTAPSSTITYPTDAMTLPPALQNYTIRGTADDGWGSGVAFVDVSTDGGATWNRAQGTASWSYVWENPVNGTYNLKSRATDVLGYVETTGLGITVTVDRPPVSTILMPVEMEAIPVTLGNYSITGATVDKGGLGVQKVEVSTDSGNTWNNAVDGSGDGSWGWWSYQWAPLPLGTYTLKARGTDNGGTVEPADGGVTVIVDGDPPTSSVTDPLDGAVIELSLGTYTITGNADDGTGGGLAFVEVSTDGGTTWHPTSWDGQWHYEWELTQTGSFNIISRATDRAGFVETPGSGNTVTVQNTPMEPLWTRQLGTAGTDQVMDVVTDSSGNSYSVGYTGGDMDGNTSSGGADMFITKYDTGGNKLWTKQLGSSSYDYAMGAAIDKDRNVYVTGYTGGDFDGENNSGGSDIFVAKYDTNGNKLWSKLLGSGLAETGRAITVDSSGKVYVAGYVYDAGTMDYYGVIYKTDPDGNVIWSDTLGVPDANERIYDVAVDSNGIAYVTGYTDGEFSGYTNAGETDIFVAKYTVGGTMSWVRQLGCSASDIAYGISLTDDCLYISGETYGDFDGNANSGEFDPFAGGYTSDAFLVKYDLNGNKLWSRQAGTPGTDKAYGVSVDGAGCAYMTGKTDMGMDGNTSAGGADLFLAKYNRNGLKLWTIQMGTTGTDQAYGISIDGNGNAYITGGTYGDLDGNTSAGSYDMFVAKFGHQLSSYITDPEDGAIINDAIYTVTGLAFDYSGTGIQTVEVTTDGGSTWTTASDTSGTGSWDTWEYAWAPPPLGNYTIRSRATDLSANVETPGVGATVTVDQVKPASAITLPLDGQVVSGISLIVTGTSDDTGTGVALVEVSTDGGNTWAAASGATSWVYVWPLPVDGVYTIKSRATDVAGNVEDAVTGITVMVDNTAPVSSVTDPLDGALLSGTDYTIIGDSNDGSGSGVSGVEVSTDGGSTWGTATDTTGLGTWASWEYTWTLPADGSHTIITKALDVAGNTETPGAGITVDVDNTPPSSSITDPADGSVVGGTSYDIIVDASDNLSGVQSVEVSTDNGGSWSAASYAAGSWNYTWTLPTEGAYTLLSRATDDAGNIETPGAGITVSVDRTAPVTAITDPADGAQLGGTGYTVSGTATDAMSGVQSVEVSTDGGASWSFANYSSGTWSYNWAYGFNGEFTIMSRGTDVVGNAETAGAGVGVSVFSRSLVSPELTHTNWDEWLTTANCDVCHATPATFLPADFRQVPSFCLSCHNVASSAHDASLMGAGEHPVFASVTSAGCALPTYGNITSAEWDNRMFANLYDTDKAVCITCHNPFKKTEDIGRVWEYTTTSDNQTYAMQNGGWSGAGYFVPKVYRDTTLWTGPTYVKDKKDYLADPSEYGYDETAGTITFGQVQDPAAYVYVTLDYPYLRASSYANRLCSDCHVQATHMGVNCLTCHSAHNTDNLAGIKGVVRATDHSEIPVVFSGYSGAGSFADGDSSYDGICEVCHTQTLYHRRDGSGFANHSSGVNQAGSDCTACHSHASGFAK